MRVGPSKLTISYQSCTGCRYLLRVIVRSGREPVYDNGCTHSGSPLFKLNNRETPIGPEDKTPIWCPVLIEKDETT